MLTGDVEGSAEFALGTPSRLYRATARRMISSDRRLLGRVVVLDDVSKVREADQVKADFNTADYYQGAYLINQAVNELCPAQIWQLRQSAAGYTLPA